MNIRSTPSSSSSSPVPSQRPAVAQGPARVSPPPTRLADNFVPTGARPPRRDGDTFQSLRAHGSHVTLLPKFQGPVNPHANLEGLRKGAEDQERVKQLQDRLKELGFMTQEQINTGYGTFGDMTEAAVKAFQASQNLPATGVIDAATAAALGDPRPPVDSRVAGVASAHAAELGRPKGEATVREDGTVVQEFDHGTVAVNPDGSVHVQAPGVERTYRPGEALEAAQASGAYVSQMEGDPNRKNNNCGYASALMALRTLGIADPTPPEGAQGTGPYPAIMELRSRGSDDSLQGDGVEASPSEIVESLNDSGASAEIVTNTWGADKKQPVDMMRQAFLDGSSQEAFIVAGNPSDGWPDNSDFDGAHYVTVVGYDPVKDVFIVMDPYLDPAGPIEVTPEQLEAYMEDGSTEAGELIHVTAGSESAG
ncbi:MAG: peptidoglycan-binding protein [Myxococcaceae bacterium]|nr:peptidoglycan-binding protein [Myxococcaceae bacterium]